MAPRANWKGFLRLSATCPVALCPKEAYMSVVEAWRELPSGEIEFTMKRLSSAD